jgi:peptidoglycan glycosyltransferase
MTKQIRHLGIGLMVCFLVLFLQLNRLTVIDAKKLNDNPNNTREILRDFSHPRGTITTADGELIARSVPSDDRYKLQREYPDGPLYAAITGYFSFTLGSAGVEKTYNDDLAGRTQGLSLQHLGDLFVEKDKVGDVTVTVRNDLQRIAQQQLGNRRGSVVALDPRTGAILALYSNPAYDPNVLADHDTNKAAAAAQALDADPLKPRLNRSYQERFFPGSTFKVVTAAAALESGKYTLDAPSFPVATEYTPPLTNRPLHNFDGEACGGNLLNALRVSCNTVFAQIGVDVGAEQMSSTAQAFGFDHDVPIDLTNPAQSTFPPAEQFTRDTPALAQSAFGQRDVSATPLQMAMVAGAVANGGKIMAPHVLDEVRDADAKVIKRYHPSVWRTAVDEATAQDLHDAMLAVVRSGTATRLAVPGFTVGGKTGTAQLGVDPPLSHAWIIGFAGPEGQAPTIAVAVIVEGQREVSNATGGRIAAPIAQSILEQYLEHPSATP